jgi:hypothetical protein
MELQKTFTGRVMRWLSIQMRMLMKVKHLLVEQWVEGIKERLSMKVGPFDVGLEGWGDNANMVTPANL